ncbi:MAG: zf-HC2 domain-containing protein [Acidobacteriota bacterium]
MECQICAENLTAYLDAELPQAESAQLASHLESCRSCREEFDSMVFARQMTEFHLPELELQPAAWNQIEGQIRSVRPARTAVPRPFRPWTPAVARPALARAAVVAILGLVALSVYVAWPSLVPNQDVERSLLAYVQQMEAKEREHTDIFASNDGFFATNPFATEDRNRGPHNPFTEEGK